MLWPQYQDQPICLVRRSFSRLPTRPEFLERIYRYLRKQADARVLQAVARPKRRRIPGGRRYDVTGEEAGERRCREHAPAVAFASREGSLDGVTSAASESGALAACERWILMEDTRNGVLGRVADR